MSGTIDQILEMMAALEDRLLVIEKRVDAIADMKFPTVEILPPVVHDPDQEKKYVWINNCRSGQCGST